MITEIATHRGFTIKKDEQGFFYERGGFIYRRCNTAWECVSSIDEQLSP